MVKYKTFYSSDIHYDAHDSKVKLFLEELEEHGHTFLKLNTDSFGTSTHVDKFRTEIIYLENPTRKVIFEKTEI